MRTRGIAVLVMLCTVAAPLRGGITYRLRAERPNGVTMSTVWAEGSSYRVQAEPSDSLSEYVRQYPITISTDGGKTRRYLRPEDKTWYEQSDETVRGSIGMGRNARVRQPKVTLTEEVSSDVIDGRPARKFVLKISYVIESEIASHKVRQHKTDTVLLSVADMSCAPEATAQPHSLRVGIREVDEAVAARLASVEGLIVRKVASHTARYEGGRPQTSRFTTDVIEPRCVDVDAAMFRVPEGYRHQEPILAVPGR